MLRLDVDRRLFGVLASKDISTTLQQLDLPLRDLDGVNIKALSKLGHGLFALERFQGHLGFELR